jgi:hypothetical protein
MSALPPKADNAWTQCPGQPSAATPFEDRRRSVINHAINRGVSLSDDSVVTLWAKAGN